MVVYGPEATLFARNEQERLLEVAITPLVTSWRHWTDRDGIEYRYAETLDGKDAHYWGLDDITPTAIREAVTNA